MLVQVLDAARSTPGQEARSPPLLHFGEPVCLFKVTQVEAMRNCPYKELPSSSCALLCVVTGDLLFPQLCLALCSTVNQEETQPLTQPVELSTENQAWLFNFHPTAPESENVTLDSQREQMKHIHRAVFKKGPACW